MDALNHLQSATSDSRAGSTHDSLPARRDSEALTAHSVRWLLATMGVALVVRLHWMRSPYLFLDEHVTLWSIGGGSYGAMLRRALQWTASGPLFVLCYRMSVDLVGDPVWGLKLPGVIAGVLCVWATWWTTRQLFRRERVAVVAAWLVATGPQFVAFSQEARPYMPTAMLLTLAAGSLAAWLRDGRRLDLMALTGCTLAAVGFHLLAALAIVAHNVTVIAVGVWRRWPRRRWVEWLVAQAALLVGLGFVGVQFRTLTGRHGSMLLETRLPMQMRQLLDGDLRSELQTEITVLLVAAVIGWFVRKFRDSSLAGSCRGDGAAALVAVISYVVPAGLLSLLATLRILDGWPRYYFLFGTGLMIVLAWMVTRIFPEKLGRCAMAALAVAMLWQYCPIGGIPACRLNTSWVDEPAAVTMLRQRLGPDDLLLSRSGLIEANDRSFLSIPMGQSYLKCFLEAGTGPVSADHIPLPFSLEAESACRYAESIARDKIGDRPDFWLANVSPADFDYRDWVRARLGHEFHKAEEFAFSSFVICHYVRVTAAMPSNSHIACRNARPFARAD